MSRRPPGAGLVTIGQRSRHDGTGKRQRRSTRSARPALVSASVGDGAAFGLPCLWAGKAR
ncbi:hypothetical protein [Dictyobacter alpinus]|uniref:hypothetical protein n=1 Tax=Dictyobacter alpinus TaxID=2014873 RepID=UPI000F83D2DD|nr:hypothetical protein [Dictyobacter alpinus]